MQFVFSFLVMGILHGWDVANCVVVVVVVVVLIK